MGYPLIRKFNLKQNNISLILGCLFSWIKSSICPWASVQRTKLESLSYSEGNSCWQSAGNDHEFLQMLFYFHVEVLFHRLLWSQGWLAATADWHPQFLSWHMKFGTSSVFHCRVDWHLAVCMFTCEQCCTIFMCRYNFVLISIVFQLVEAMADKKTRFFCRAAFKAFIWK